jgi:stress-induced morphogen
VIETEIKTTRKKVDGKEDLDRHQQINSVLHQHIRFA